MQGKKIDYMAVYGRKSKDNPEIKSNQYNEDKLQKQYIQSRQMPKNKQSETIQNLNLRDVNKNQKNQKQSQCQSQKSYQSQSYQSCLNYIFRTLLELKRDCFARWRMINKLQEVDRRPCRCCSMMMQRQVKIKIMAHDFPKILIKHNRFVKEIINKFKSNREFQMKNKEIQINNGSLKVDKDKKVNKY